MIEIEDLHYHYPDGTAALKGVSLTIADGEFLLLCGPNGSGKTTLIRHMNGLLKPASGRVRIDGADTSHNGRQAVLRAGMVFQDADAQIVGETIWEDVAFGPENMGLPSQEVATRVAAALETVGLAPLADKPCHLLSGGEKRRVAIAGVLAMRPSIVIFDEPFANLDYPGVRQVLEQIVALHQQGHTIVMTTHDVEKVVAHVDRIAVIYKGELKTVGVPEIVLPNLTRYHIRPPCSSLIGGKVLSWLTD